MNTPFYIAKRYLISKKKHNIINIISGISILGVTIGTAALIIVLSVFNGFESMVVSLFNSFEPDIKIEAVSGKYFTQESLSLEKLKQIQGVKFINPVQEENALIKYADKQYIATIKGVSDDFTKMNGLDSMIVDGKLMLNNANRDYAVLGYGIAFNLDLNLNDINQPLNVYVPQRNANISSDLLSAFNIESITPSGVFSVQSEWDNKYLIAPIRFTSKLLQREKQYTAIEIAVSKDMPLYQIQENIINLAGPKFTVKNRFQIHESLYKILKTEKLAVFLILTFILIIAIFNVVGSLTMLIIEKKKDISILKSLGADNAFIKKIFLIEGTAISFVGALFGIFIGFITCFLQLKFNLIKVGGNDSLTLKYFPVDMHFIDFLIVFLTVFGIGLIAAWIPVRQINKKFLNEYQRLLVK